MLSTSNWGGQGLHPRGNFEAFIQAASDQKWLEVHGIEHWTEFYTDYGVNLQKRFFDHFLKGADNDWPQQAPVQLQVRTVDGFVQRAESNWPLADTNWTRMYLDPSEQRLIDIAPGLEDTLEFDAMGDGITFSTPPLDHETEITGPIAAKLFASSTTTDADLFLVLRVFAPDGDEVVFQGALDPHTPIAQGWLRASHRKLDPTQSEDHRPFHTHDEIQPLTPGTVYELDIEIWPTCIVVPAGYRIALTVRGKDYEYPGGGTQLTTFANELTGCGPFLHDDPDDRPAHTFGGATKLHFGADREAFVLLPIIPTRN
jgi:predicted acyl esterase